MSGQLPPTFELLPATVFPLLVVLMLFVLIRYTVKWLITARKTARFARLHGCTEPSSKFPGFPFGFGYVVSFIPFIRAHRFTAYTYELFTRLGPTFVVSVFGKVVIHTNDPENLKCVLSTSSQDYDIIPAREMLAKTIYGNGIISANGHDWIQSRSLVRQALKSMTHDADAFEQHADLLVEDLKARGSGSFNFCDNSWRYTSDLVFELYFGESTRSKEPWRAQRSSDLAAGFAYLGQLSKDVTLFGKRIPYVISFLHPGWRRKRSAVEAILDAHFEAARKPIEKPNIEIMLGTAAQGKRKTLVQALAETTDDASRAKAEIMNLMLAGGDTVAITLNETIWLLARNPRVWAKLRKEVLAACSGQKLNLRDIKKLEYLRCVVNESIRIRPTLSVHGRYSSCDSILPRGGAPDGDSPILVPKGAYVLYSNYSLYRNPAVFGPDVEIFRPERWLGYKDPSAPLPEATAGNWLKVGHYEYMSFGAGARACPGEKLGFSMVAYTIARLAQEFEAVEARDDREWEEATVFSFFNRNGVHVEFKKAGEASQTQSRC